MRIDIYIPDFDVSSDEITLSAWYKKIGDKISKNEIIADAETTEVSCGITSSYDCILAEIIVQQGEVVSHGTKIAVIETELDGDINDIKQNTLVNDIKQKSAIIDDYLKKDLAKHEEQEKRRATEAAEAERLAAAKRAASENQTSREGKVSSFVDKSASTGSSNGYSFSVSSHSNESTSSPIGDSLSAAEVSVTNMANQLESSIELNAIETAKMLKSDETLVEKYGEDVIEELSTRTEEKFLNILKSAGEKGKEEARRLLEEVIAEAKKQALQQAELLKAKILKEYEDKARKDAAEAHQKIVQGSIVKAENTRTKIINEAKEKADEEARLLREEIIRTADAEAKAKAADAVVNSIVQAKENASIEAERISREIVENTIRDAKNNAKEVKKDIIHSAHKRAAKEALQMIRKSRAEALVTAKHQADEIIESSLQHAKTEADCLKASLLQSASLEAELIKSDIMQSATQEAENIRSNVITAATKEAETLKDNILTSATQEAETMKNTVLQSADREAELMKTSILQAANREIANAVGCVMFEVKEKSIKEIKQAIEKIAIHETEMIKKGLLQSASADAQYSISSIINNVKERTSSDIRSVVYTLSQETELLKNRTLQHLHRNIKETINSLMSEIAATTGGKMKDAFRHMADILEEDTGAGKPYRRSNGYTNGHGRNGVNNGWDKKASDHHFRNSCHHGGIEEGIYGNCCDCKTKNSSRIPEDSNREQDYVRADGARRDPVVPDSNQNIPSTAPHCTTPTAPIPADTIGVVASPPLQSHSSVSGTFYYDDDCCGSCCDDAFFCGSEENFRCYYNGITDHFNERELTDDHCNPPSDDDLHEDLMEEICSDDDQTIGNFTDCCGDFRQPCGANGSDIDVGRTCSNHDHCSTDGSAGMVLSSAMLGSTSFSEKLDPISPSQEDDKFQEKFEQNLLKYPQEGDPAIYAANWKKPTFFASPNDKSVPLDLLKQRIHEKMKESMDTAIISTVSNEIDMSAILSLEKNFGDAFTKKYNTRLGFTPFFVIASIFSLKKYKIFNAHIIDNNIIYKSNFDISIITCGNDGVIAPVIRHADKLSIAEIEKIMINLSRRAVEGTLSIEEVSGGTFTVVNAGVFGSILGTDLLTPPQVATLSVHRMYDRPVATDGDVEVRPMLYISLSYDHRISDTKKASEFLENVKRYVENPGWNMLDL